MAGARKASGSERVMLVVSPRSRGALSLFDAPPATAETVAAVRSSPDVIEAAVRELRALEMEVLQVSDTSITVSAPRSRVEALFGAKLRKVKRTVLAGAPKVDSFDVLSDGDVAPQFLAPPERLAGLIEGAVPVVPPEYFASALPPIALPAPAAYRWLTVPSEVGLLLNAARLHRLGTTGLGVRIAMVDSGQYAHPFFHRYGYRVLATVLGPGATDPSSDPLGHGTGESANLFAAAPDIELVPIKMAADATGAFNAAIAQKPRVITCSWGYDVDHPGQSLPAYLKPLAAAVADAVAKKITVCFSAGNLGKRGFPASHPDVIAVGGVHVNHPQLTLEASSYASSFLSSFFPGRAVPDVCGLVGRSVSGAAPLVMLPVPPGSALDTSNTGSTSDGWGIFSGTSAACPQVAAICALLLQKSPGATPAQIRKVLRDSATDVTTGQSAMGHPAGPGADLATGAGLANAKWAWLITMGAVAAEFFAGDAAAQQAMLVTGRMPALTQEMVEELIGTLRTHV